MGINLFAMGIGAIELIILVAIVLMIVSLARRFGARGVVLGIAGTVVGLGMISAVMFMLFQEKRSYDESVSVSAADESISYSRSIGSKPASQAKSTSTRLELIPTPSDNPPVILEKSEETPADSSTPNWMQFAETSSPGDAPSVVSDGPRPELSECRVRIGPEVKNYVTHYAQQQGLHALSRRPNLLTDRVLQDVVSEEHITTNSIEFSGTQQTWYTLHQLLKYDSSVQQQLAELNNRATGDERLVALSAGTLGILGLLSLAFVALKATETKNPRPAVSEASTEWKLGVQYPEKAKSNVSTIVVTAIVVSILIGILSLLG